MKRFKILNLIVLLVSVSIFGQKDQDIDSLIDEKFEFDKYYNHKKNIYVKDGVIFIFIDKDGNLLKSGIPTVATERHKFQIVIITTKNDLKTRNYIFSYDGIYAPKFNVINGDSNILTNKNDEGDFLFPHKLPIIGPFTSKVTINIKDKKKEIFKSTINIAKKYYASITSGLFMTTLKNPTDIRKLSKEDGAVTLIANDDNVRGMAAVTAVFYPKGRSFLFPPTGDIFDASRFGVLIGTRLDKNQFENFIGGIQIDFSRGASVAFGAHFGRRNEIVGFDNFEFGIDNFEGDLENSIIKKWGVGVFFGVNLDLRVFGQLFK